MDTKDVCPKCGHQLVLVYTRNGRKLKRCSTNGWDPEKKQATGCDYVEWLHGTTEETKEACPKCGKPVVLYTTVNGNKVKKCSTNRWDRENRRETGCDYVRWLHQG